ncbi:type IV secretory system conjugative DNA transfer family protein [Aquibacillus sp. 3ASR75-11]|uniref:Type IV secretory system conjugative DNA transfer family protein n=1 Tax=Terrihalobacillus insolitus TaxID=2950438 RepID=A0A9X3WU59_9BACI|nr:type IV secretory system conjugative DNA transfer family protein [Terrihalobacillus insolitus]MDC3424296.1 type IV secretory system conjugative DNA transfer family protein [Terrihalobacillus insolitus]
MKEVLIKKSPLILTIILLLVSFWLSIRALANYIFLMVGQFTDSIPVFLLFGNPLHPSLLGLVVTTVVSIFAWLVSTKVKTFQKMVWRTFIFFQMFFGITAYYTWMITAPIYNSVVPYLQERVAEVDVVNVWHSVLIGNTDNLMILLVFLPGIVITLLLIWLGGQYSLHNDTLKEVFEEFEFKSRFLQRFFRMGEDENWPDVELGPDSETNELIIQPGKDRTLNNVIIGSIGTGKTAALVLPILNQDLHWMTRFINDFPKQSQREDYHTEEVKGMYLNGISVIEPSNDLCQKTFQLVKAHKIPEESVFYIDPTNPNTPNINPMQGPVDQVAEAFAMVIEGLAEGGDGGNFFFQQSERNHLKHYIYLLKLHEPDKEVTFDMLLDMYNNSQLVRQMHVKLKGTFPDDIEQIEDRDERNHWKIVQQVDEWFDLNLLPKTNRQGQPEQITTGDYRGEIAYYDAKAEYVQGLRNILNDIGANKLIRRVLFGKSNFDFDKHLEYGGVLLLNTAKGELAGLSNILGKLVLLSLQNAVFRRTPNSSNFHHILVDEFPDFIYRPFKEFPAQSRKYKTIVTVVAQTVSQLADKYGETYMHTLLGTLRHKMVYGDIPDYDAQLFSAIFGEEERFEETQSEQTVSPLQESPSLRAGNSFAKTKEAILSPSDIIFQKQFQAAVKIVKNNRPMPVRQIDANFVPKPEFNKAVMAVVEENGALWLSERDRMLTHEPVLVDTPIEEEESEDQSNEEGEQGEEVEIVAELDTQRKRPIDYPTSNRLRKRNSTKNQEVVEGISPNSFSKPAPIAVFNKEDTVTEEINKDKLDTETVHPQKVETTDIPIDEDFDPLGNVFGEQDDTEGRDETEGNAEPSVSELSEEHNQLLNEIKKETDKVKSDNEPTSNNNDLSSIMEDYE